MVDFNKCFFPGHCGWKDEVRVEDWEELPKKLLLRAFYFLGRAVPGSIASHRRRKFISCVTRKRHALCGAFRARLPSAEEVDAVECFECFECLNA